MNWNTLYIKGKHGFETEVEDHLLKTKLNVMPGSTLHDECALLFWISEGTQLHEIKKALGGKLIFKYRLKFYKSLEELRVNEGLDLDKKIISLESAYLGYKNIA